MREERRDAVRHVVQLPAEIDAGAGDVRNALTRDGSATGLLVLTQGNLEPGQRVKVRCFLGETGNVVDVVGTVVRQEPLEGDAYSLYRSRVAVRLYAPHLALGERFAALAQSFGSPPAS